MPVYYQLPCECGNAIPVETSQAGQEVVCPFCRATRIVPTLMRIKKLPVLGQAESGGAPSSGSTAGPPSADSEDTPKTDLLPGEYAVNPRRIVFYAGIAATLITLPLFLYVLLGTRPKSTQVLEKEVFKQFAGRFAYQNSTPLPRNEEMILAVSHEYIDWMLPTEAYFYLDTIGDNPNFSYEFQENFQTVKERYAIRTVFFAIALGLALLLLCASPFVPSRTRQIGLRSGAAWKHKSRTNE